MSRPISALFHEALLAQHSDQALLTLIEITHPNLETTIRLVNDTKSVVSGGETYLPYFFALVFPEEENGRIKEVSLVMDNVDRQITLAVRSIDSPPNVSVKFVLSDTPDIVEVSLPDMVLRNVSYDASTISGELVYEERVQYQIPALTINANDFPGAWQ